VAGDTLKEAERVELSSRVRMQLTEPWAKDKAKIDW
jgi:hypothetical protein